MASLSPAWRGALVRVALAWLALIAAFWPDWAGMAGQWWNSSTYNHMLLIAPIAVWLAWQRAPAVVELEPEAWWPGLVLAAGAMFLWVLGAFAGLTLASDLGAVALLVAATLTLLGPRVGVALAFPLFYLFLMVPFGDELIATLQMVTAKITIALTHMSGIPARIDGVYIDTPAGLFEVAEACSGVKFLIAMVAFGLLVANVCFVSWRRRAMFFVVCLIVPVLANGVRAWGTIYAAQFFGIAVAAGFDHIVYGWIFFAVVIALVLAGAWRFFDRPAGAPLADAGLIAASPLLARLARLRIAPLAALAGLVMLVAVGQGWAYAADRLSAPLPARIDLPQVPGWHRTDYRPDVWWEPRATGADHRLLGSYADTHGHRVDVFLAVYATQGEGREAGGFGQGALTPGAAWNWLSPGPSFAAGKSDRLLANGHVARLAVTWYRTGGVLTGSNTRLKLANMADRLRLREEPTILLIVSEEEGSAPPAEQSIAAFIRAAGPLGAWMDRAAANR